MTEGGAGPILVHRVIARLNVGGPAIHVVNLGAAESEGGLFRSRLIAGEVTSDEGDMEHLARAEGIEVTHLPGLSRLVSPLDDLRTLWTLYRLFRRERPTIVDTHTAKAGTLGRLAALLAGVPIRIHTYHGHVLGGGYFSPLVTLAYLEIERQLARFSQRLIVLTEAQKEEMSSALRVAAPEEFRVIALGVDLSEYVSVDRKLVRDSTRTALGILEDEVVVGIVGRLVPIKNHELLFRSHLLLERILGKPVRILVIGGGERKEELREFVDGLGRAEQVSWLGWRADLHNLYPALDAVALTSLDEGTPMALIEAMAAGTPVVARAVGGVEEMLRDLPLGRTVLEDCPEAMARALSEVLGAGPDDMVVEEARQRVADRYSVPRLVKATQTVYMEELRRAGLA
jgi:glycosyltransferase involved in cell wall biosynthesis